MLEGVVDGGTGTAANLTGYDVAGKTGTAQDYTNVYFAGYTKQYATAIWVGFPEGQIPLSNYYGTSVFGGTVAAPIWHTFMAQIMSGLPNIPFPAPPKPERGTVPDVVGMNSQEAQTALSKAGFVPVVEQAPSEAPKDEVFEQSPGGGTSALLGTMVKISVSNGKLPNQAVPDVRGMTQSNAASALRKLGFVVKIVTADVVQKDKDGLVLAQSPPPGSKADIGSVVSITVGKYSPKPSPSPK
jgi:membrane peptidoglycan carboxypeptidase